MEARLGTPCTQVTLDLSNPVPTNPVQLPPEKTASPEYVGASR